jgi:hypothetical protein
MTALDRIRKKIAYKWYLADWCFQASIVDFYSVSDQHYLPPKWNLCLRLPVCAAGNNISPTADQ